MRTSASSARSARSVDRRRAPSAASVSTNREPKPTPRKDLFDDRRRIPAALGGPPIRPHQLERRPSPSRQLRVRPPSRFAQPRQRRALLFAGPGGAQPAGSTRPHAPPSVIMSTSRGCSSPPCRRARRISTSSSPRSPLPTRWSPNTPTSARCWRRAPGPTSSVETSQPAALDPRMGDHVMGQTPLTASWLFRGAPTAQPSASTKPSG